MLAKSLKKGDTIGIIFPSSRCSDERSELWFKGIKKLEDYGFKVKLCNNYKKTDKFNVSGGSPIERANDLNNMFADSEIDAIFCAHGGNTANEILDYIDYESIKQNPKMFQGMSNIDVLHLAINKLTGLVTFSGSDPKCGRGLDLDLEYSWNAFVDRLIDKSKVIKASDERKCLKSGIAKGKLLGANLNAIQNLLGTKYFPDFNNSILFLEIYKETVAKTLMKLEQFKQAGIFDNINGIVIGYNYSFQDEEVREEFGVDCDFEDIIIEVTKNYNFPILKTNDFGHRCPKCVLPIGAEVRMDADKKEIEIISDFLI